MRVDTIFSVGVSDMLGAGSGSAFHEVTWIDIDVLAADAIVEFIESLRSRRT